jgi:tetratricopeptide (TPR) repeat protein
MMVLARVCGRLDELARARELSEGALAIRRELHAGAHAETAEALQQLATVLTRQREHGLADAAGAEAEEMLRRLLGENHPLVADALDQRGTARFYAEDYAGAASYFRAGLAIHRRAGTPDGAVVASSLANLGKALTNLKQFGEAEACLREAMAVHEKLGHTSEVLSTLEGLAQLRWQSGDRAGAEGLYLQELELARAFLPQDHPRLSWILTGYAVTVGSNRGPAAAEALFREALQISRKAYEPMPHRSVAQCLKLLGGNLRRQGKEEEARRQFAEAADVLERLFGPDNAETVATRRLAEGRPAAPTPGAAPSPAGK